jgi:hypothetical protein
MVYPFWGLPGGSSDEGPGTTLGILMMALVTLFIFGGLLALLFYTAEMIEHPPPSERYERLVDSFAVSDNG